MLADLVEVVVAHVVWVFPHRFHELVDGRHIPMVPRAVPWSRVLGPDCSGQISSGAVDKVVAGLPNSLEFLAARIKKPAEGERLGRCRGHGHAPILPGIRPAWSVPDKVDSCLGCEFKYVSVA